MSDVTTLDINGIMLRLPHRYPFLLVDRVLECVRGQSIRALKNVTYNEPFFTGHFPHPADHAGRHHHRGAGAGDRAAGVPVSGRAAAMTHAFYFVGIDKARFRKPVEPGDQLILECALRAQRQGHLALRHLRPVAGQEVANAIIMIAPDLKREVSFQTAGAEP